MSHCPARCRRCDRPLVPQLTYRSPGRAASVDNAPQRHIARGLCGRCRTAAEKDGTLHTYPTTKNAIDADEFARLAAAGATDLALAGHFGVSLAAVRQHRSRRRRAAA